MESLERIQGFAVPLMQANIDTDQIIPARFMPRVLVPGGLREGLFAEWRLQADGTPRADFILNRAPYAQAPILLAGPNFGCGSSREQAAKALRQWGIRAIVAPSFGEIFYGNCFRNGIVPVILPGPIVDALAAGALAAGADAVMVIDLRESVLLAPSGDRHAFRSPSRLRRMLLTGQDEISATLAQAGRIDAYRAADRQRRAWAYDGLQAGDVAR